ncbi:MAG: fumarate hydratase [Spirochaetia bacterium]
MREISRQDIFNRVYEGIRELNVRIPADVRQALTAASAAETGLGKKVLERILENIELAKDKQRPVCQDTGMLLAMITIGTGVRIAGEEIAPHSSSDRHFIGSIIEEATEAAYRDGFFRKSVVSDPLKQRTNSDTNLPPVLHYELVPGDGLEIALLAKGFGSENCSAIHMLKPTAGKEEVLAAVVDTVRRAGGSPCPPTVLGIGIGGTMEKAALLSKRALLRDLSASHPDPWYAELEAEILAAVNKLGIGPGGLGGRTTSLAVKVETYPTHIAGLPVAITVNCWADRKLILSWPSQTTGAEGAAGPAESGKAE